MKVEIIDLNYISIFCYEIKPDGNSEMNYRYKAVCPELDITFYSQTEQKAIEGLKEKIKMRRAERVHDFLQKLRANRSHQNMQV